MVRQRDAHAWTEVWLQDRSWVRIDPTTAVSQDRIELGMSELLPNALPAPLFFSQSEQLIDIWQQLRNNWDTVNNTWNRSILAYGPELQKSFLSKLGMINPNWQSMAITLFAAFSLVLLITSAVLLYPRREPDPVAATYQQFCQRFVKLGLVAWYAHEAQSIFPVE